MMNLKTALALCAGAAMLMTAGCSSSSSNPAAGNGDASMEASDDAGAVDDSGSQDEGDAATCMPTNPDKGCASGTTCCFDPMSALSGGIAALAGGLKGNCSDPTACTGSVQVKCLTTDGCAAGQVCCLSSTSLGPGAAEAGAGGGIAGLLSFNAITTCQTSCPAGQVQACKKDSDCMGTNAGMVCSPLSLGALGGGGAAGAVGGGMLTAILGGLATETVCSPSDGGPPTSDGGTMSDAAAPDAGPPDGGPADAGAADAPANGG